MTVTGMQLNYKDKISLQIQQIKNKISQKKRKISQSSRKGVGMGLLYEHQHRKNADIWTAHLPY